MFSKSSSIGLKLFVAVMAFLGFFLIIKREIPYFLQHAYSTLLTYIEIIGVIVFIVFIVFILIDYLTNSGFNGGGMRRI